MIRKNRSESRAVIEVSEVVFRDLFIRMSLLFGCLSFNPVFNSIHSRKSNAKFTNLFKVIKILVYNEIARNVWVMNG